MNPHDTEEVRFKHSRFSARLPLDRLYTASHFWLKEHRPGVWRVGITRFAQRMLGDIVEMDFEVAPGDAVEVGRIVGWIEAYKAVSDLFAVAGGRFLGGNPKIKAEGPGLIDADATGEGWLYEIEGMPDPAATDAHGYAEMLRQTIDRLRGTEHDRPDPDPETT